MRPLPPDPAIIHPGFLPVLWHQGPEAQHEINGVLGHNSALYGYSRPETTWANEMNFVMNHTPYKYATDAFTPRHMISWNVIMTS